jgi:hypothetical protein
MGCTSTWGVGHRVGRALKERTFLGSGFSLGRKLCCSMVSSVSGMGADDALRKVHSVMGASKRVTISGTWCLSNSAISLSSSLPFIPCTSNSAIFAHRFKSFGSTSRTFRFEPVPPFPFACCGLKAYFGNLRRWASCSSFAFACHFWRSISGMLFHAIPMIFERVEWLVSTS